MADPGEFGQPDQFAQSWTAVVRLTGIEYGQDLNLLTRLVDVALSSPRGDILHPIDEPQLQPYGGESPGVVFTFSFVEQTSELLETSHEPAPPAPVAARAGVLSEQRSRKAAPKKVTAKKAGTKKSVAKKSPAPTSASKRASGAAKATTGASSASKTRAKTSARSMTAKQQGTRGATPARKSAEPKAPARARTAATRRATKRA